MKINVEKIKIVLDKARSARDRALASYEVFTWSESPQRARFWADECTRLDDGLDLSIEARAYLEKLIEPEPKMQSFWVNIYLYRGAYTVGGAVRSSAEEAAQARHDLGREYVGAVEIKLPILQKEQQS